MGLVTRKIGQFVHPTTTPRSRGAPLLFWQPWHRPPVFLPEHLLFLCHPDSLGFVGHFFSLETGISTAIFAVMASFRTSSIPQTAANPLPLFPMASFAPILFRGYTTPRGPDTFPMASFNQFL